jgi:hypothetical protein
MSEPVHTSETPATGAPEQPPVTIQVGDQPPGQPAVETATDANAKPTETVDYWKQRARQNEQQAKANAEAAKRLKEIEDRDLSELQKAQRDREEIAAENARLKSESARNRVALAKGLPAEIAATLNGSTEDELAAHADALLAWRSNVPPTTPRPDPGQGPRPTTPESDAEQEYRLFFPQG